jgi:hypothetical protein
MTVDLLSPLEPPREDVERLVGTIRGNTEGLGAGLECWCGPLIGWRAFGDLVLGGGQATIIRQHGRMTVGLAFDLGEAPPMRRHADAEGGEP